MSHRSFQKTRYRLLLLAIVGLSFSGCIYELGLPAGEDQTFAPINPVQGMHIQPSFKDQQAQPVFRAGEQPGMRTPPPGTVPVDGHLHSQFVDLEAAEALENPVPLTEKSVEYGRYLYETNCSVCHGDDGHGSGPVISAGFGQPPTLNSAALRAQPDGRIYHVVTYGQNAMWPYKNSLDEMERWAVVNYVRALQRADLPEPTDLDQLRRQ